MAAPPPKRRKEGRQASLDRIRQKTSASSRFDIVSSSSVLASPVESDSGCVILRQHIAREHIPPHTACLPRRALPVTDGPTCSAEGLSAITVAASCSAFEAFCSPMAAMTWKRGVERRMKRTKFTTCRH